MRIKRATMALMVAVFLAVSAGEAFAVPWNYHCTAMIRGARRDGVPMPWRSDSPYFWDWNFGFCGWFSNEPGQRQ